MNSLEQLLKKYQESFDIIDVINLDDWYSLADAERPLWLRNKIESLYTPCYEQQKRII